MRALLWSPSSGTHRCLYSYCEQVGILLRTVINKCLEDGAKVTNIVHMYLAAEGMDLNFVFNPAGKHAVTIIKVLQGDGLQIMLKQFEKMIQILQ